MMGNSVAGEARQERVPFRSDKPFAIVVHNVFSPEECDALIARAEAAGFTVAEINAGGGRQVLATNIRNSARCIIDDAEVAAQIFERVRPFLPETWQFYGEEWRIEEVNERLRFLRYDPGEFFAPHMDGNYLRPDDHPKGGDLSMITLQLYLNEGFEGGSTRFFGGMEKGKSEYDVIPKTGSVLLFEHRLSHSGEEVVRGRKYAIRTDIMYTRRA